MRVVVKFHDSARSDYEEWQARLHQPPAGNAGVARIHAEELIRQLHQHRGMPPGAHIRQDLVPPARVWRFSSDTWIRYVVRERRLGLWGETVVEVIITAVVNQPPG